MSYRLPLEVNKVSSAPGRGWVIEATDLKEYPTKEDAEYARDLQLQKYYEARLSVESWKQE